MPKRKHYSTERSSVTAPKPSPEENKHPGEKRCIDCGQPFTPKTKRQAELAKCDACLAAYADSDANPR